MRVGAPSFLTRLRRGKNDRSRVGCTCGKKVPFRAPPFVRPLHNPERAFLDQLLDNSLDPGAVDLVLRVEPELDAQRLADPVFGS